MLMLLLILLFTHARLTRAHWLSSFAVIVVAICCTTISGAVGSRWLISLRPLQRVASSDSAGCTLRLVLMSGLMSSVCVVVAKRGCFVLSLGHSILPTHADHFVWLLLLLLLRLWLSLLLWCGASDIKNRQRRTALTLLSHIHLNIFKQTCPSKKRKKKNSNATSVTTIATNAQLLQLQQQASTKNATNINYFQ